MTRHLDSLVSQRNLLKVAGWRILLIGDVLESSKYGCNAPATPNGNVAVVGMKDLFGGKVYLTDLTRVQLAEKEFDEYRLKRGDVLINRTNSYDLVGKVGVFDSDQEAAFVSYLVRLRGKKNIIDQAYLNFWLNTSIAQRIIKRIATRAISQANLNPTEFKRHCPVPVPPLPEQKAIAAVLQCWDYGIQKLEAKLAAKERVKQGLMQQLLSGQMRMPGFGREGRMADGKWRMPEGWKMLKIGDLSTIKKGTQLSRINQEKEGPYPVLNGGIYALGYTNEWNSEANTITISEGGNSCGFVGLMRARFWCGGHCYSVKPKKGVENEFLFQLLKHNQTSIMRLRVGSGLPNIQKSVLESLPLPLPPFKEQEAIVRVLSAADREIEALRRKLEARKAQKRYLLNHLVDGTIRLPQFIESETEVAG